MSYGKGMGEIIDFTGSCPYPQIVPQFLGLPLPAPSPFVSRGCGMGALTMDGTGLLGTGLFSGGMDLSTWGVGEYVAAALGAYVLFSVVSTTGRGASKVRRAVRRRRKAAA